MKLLLHETGIGTPYIYGFFVVLEKEYKTLKISALKQKKLHKIKFYFTDYQIIINVKISDSKIKTNNNLKILEEIKAAVGLVQQYLQEIGGSVVK